MSQPVSGPAYVTTREVADLLRVSKMTVCRIIAAGDLPGTIRIGRAYRIPLRSVRAYLGEHDVRRSA